MKFIYTMLLFLLCNVSRSQTLEEMFSVLSAKNPDDISPVSDVLFSLKRDVFFYDSISQFNKLTVTYAAAEVGGGYYFVYLKKDKEKVKAVINLKKQIIIVFTERSYSNNSSEVADFMIYDFNDNYKATFSFQRHDYEYMALDIEKGNKRMDLINCNDSWAAKTVNDPVCFPVSYYGAFKDYKLNQFINLIDYLFNTYDIE